MDDHGVGGAGPADHLRQGTGVPVPGRSVGRREQPVEFPGQLEVGVAERGGGRRAQCRLQDPEEMGGVEPDRVIGDGLHPEGEERLRHNLGGSRRVIPSVVRE